MVELK